MELTRDDAVLYFYNVGVVLSSAWAILYWGGGGNRLFLVGFSAVLGLGWTVYFRWRVAPRLHGRWGMGPDDDTDDTDEPPDQGA